MASPSRGLLGWSWWPLRWPAVVLLGTLTGFLASDFIFIRTFPLSVFIALVIAAPYAIIFVLGFPAPPSPLERFRRR